MFHWESERVHRAIVRGQIYLTHPTGNCGTDQRNSRKLSSCNGVDILDILPKHNRFVPVHKVLTSGMSALFTEENVEGVRAFRPKDDDVLTAIYSARGDAMNDKLSSVSLKRFNRFRKS